MLGTKPLENSIRHFIRDHPSCECRIIQWRHYFRLFQWWMKLGFLRHFLLRVMVAARRCVFSKCEEVNENEDTKKHYKTHCLKSAKSDKLGLHIIKRTLLVDLKNMNFMFSWRKQYLTSVRSHCSTKFTSSSHRVISSFLLHLPII